MTRSPHALQSESDVLAANLGKTVHLLRKTAKLSQQRMGELLRVHQSAVSRIEKGEQWLSPEQLYIISQYFGVPIDTLMAGDVDFWSVSDRFRGQAPLPERYRTHTHSRVRELRPFLSFIQMTKGDRFYRDMLESMGVDPALFLNLDLRIGTRLTLDVLRKGIEEGAFNRRSIKHLAAQARTPESQGFLHAIFSTQEEQLALVKLWLLNSHHYDTNFKYEIEACKTGAIDVSIRPTQHLRELGEEYKDKVLGDFICRYKQTYFSQFPNYIGKAALDLVEDQCHFQGADRCVYKLRVA